MVVAHSSAVGLKDPPRHRGRRIPKPTHSHSTMVSSRDHDATHTAESASEADTDHCSRSCSSNHESHSDTSDANTSYSVHHPGSSPTRINPQSKMNTTLLHESRRRQDEEWSPNKAWYQFDSAVLIALVSPIGHWLTGGDHVKNLFFIVLLVYYLHQVIEAPWNLYQKARHRRRHPQLPPITSEDKHRDLAVSELRKLELFFLLLTTFSPFLGAYLLHYATQLIVGPDAISWFSTGLFVMATGIRPWSHLVERLSRRTMDLQDFIHYPPTPDQKNMQDQIDVLTSRLQELEASLSRLKSRLQGTADEVLACMDDTVDIVERMMRKYERKLVKQESRLKSIEMSLEKGKITAINAQPAQSFLRRFLPTWPRLPPGESPSNGLDYSPTSTNGHFEIVLDASTSTISSGSLLDRPINLAYSIAHNVVYVMTMPLRVAFRMIFGKH